MYYVHTTVEVLEIHGFSILVSINTNKPFVRTWKIFLKYCLLKQIFWTPIYGISFTTTFSFYRIKGPDSMVGGIHIMMYDNPNSSDHKSSEEWS